MQIYLEIITPEKVILKEYVDSIIVPAYDGELGILPGHTHLLAQLVHGEVRVKKSQEETVLAISGGFVEIHPDKVELFAETADLAQEIDEELARQEIEKAKQELKTVKTDTDFQRTQTVLRVALTKLKIHKSFTQKKQIRR